MLLCIWDNGFRERNPTRNKEHPKDATTHDHPDRIHVAFDDRRLINNAGLILPATLALHLGLPQLVDRHLDLGDAPGRAHPGDKVMTLVASAPRFRGGRVWLAATASTTPTRCALAGRLAPSAAWSRHHPPWVPSCFGPEKRALRSVFRLG